MFPQFFRTVKIMQCDMRALKPSATLLTHFANLYQSINQSIDRSISQ